MCSICQGVQSQMKLVAEATQQTPHTGFADVVLVLGRTHGGDLGDSASGMRGAAALGVIAHLALLRLHRMLGFHGPRCGGLCRAHGPR